MSMLQNYLLRTFKPTIDSAIAEAIVSSQQSRKLQMQSIESLRGMAVAEGLRHLFEKDYFSICQLQDCVRAARLIPDGETMRILAPLHCRNWANMPRDLRDEVFTRVMQMFGIEADATLLRR